MLQEHDLGGLQRFRCVIGHAYGPESLLEQQASGLDHALAAALSALEAFYEHLATHLKDAGREPPELED